MGENERIRRCNAEDREDLIKDLGREEFEASRHYEELRDIPPPPCMAFVFEAFIELYNMSGEGGITFADIETYRRVRRVELSQYEIDCLIKCRGWAQREINRLDKEE